MYVKKQELELRKQEQEQMMVAQNQQRDMFKQNDKTTTGSTEANA